MDKDRLTILKQTLETLQNGVTKSELLKSMEGLMSLILKREQNINAFLSKMEKELTGKNSDNISALLKMFDDLKGENKKDISEIVTKYEKALKKALKDQADSLNFIRDTVRGVTSGKDGKDGVDGKAPTKQELEAIIKPLIPKVELPNLDEVKKDIEDLKTRPVGGGVTNMRIIQAFKYILKTEVPSGAIDGVNTTYTVSQPIFAVLAFSMNKAVIAQIPNYTISGRTIEFASALPAAYSGRDFEIKFI